SPIHKSRFFIQLVILLTQTRVYCLFLMLPHPARASCNCRMSVSETSHAAAQQQRQLGVAMAASRSSLRAVLPIAILSILQFPAMALAQQPDPNGNPFETEERMTGCTRLAVFPPLPSAKVTSCQKSDSVEVSMPLKPDASGYAQEKKVRGAY